MQPPPWRSEFSCDAPCSFFRPSIFQAFNRPGLQSSKPSIVQAFYLGQNRSDLQDLGDCTQSSQIGPHLVQPLSARPIETTLTSRTHRRNMTPSPQYWIIGPKS